MRIIVHITHNDGDAVGCDLVLRNVYIHEDDNIQTYWCNPNTVDEIATNLIEKWESENLYPSVVIISDISVSLKTWNILVMLKEKYGFKLQLFDHHPTNPCKQEKYAVVKSCTSDGVPISAAKIMYQYYIDDIIKHHSDDVKNALYILVESISRYDTWEWRTNPSFSIPSESIISDICKFIGPDETVRLLIEHLSSIKCANTAYPEYFINLYNAIELKKKQSFENLEDFVKITKEGEYIYASFIASSEYTNEIAEAIYDTYDIDIVRILYPNSCKIGFRTKRNDLNVGRIAQRLYGGGGHPKASGAKISLDEFIILFSNVMTAPSLRESTEI